MWFCVNVFHEVCERVTKDGSENVDLTKWLNISTFVEIEGDLEDELVKTNQRKSEKYLGNMKPV